MTDPRDYRNDPRLSEPSNDLRGRHPVKDGAVPNTRTGTSIWSWLAGIAAAVLIIAIIYGFTNRDTQTAVDSNVPPARTGATTSSGTTGADTTATAPGGPATGAGGGATGSGPSGSGGATTSGSGTTAPGPGAR